MLGKSGMVCSSVRELVRHKPERPTDKQLVFDLLPWVDVFIPFLFILSSFFPPFFPFLCCLCLINFKSSSMVHLPLCSLILRFIIFIFVHLYSALA